MNVSSPLPLSWGKEAPRKLISLTVQKRYRGHQPTAQVRLRGVSPMLKTAGVFSSCRFQGRPGCAQRGNDGP